MKQNLTDKRSAMRKIRKVVFISFVPFIIFLTGCSSMNSKFDCPSQPGVTCKSIDQVNDMVDRGLIGRSNTTDNIKRFSNPKFYPTENNLNIVNTANNASSLTKPLRVGEQVVRIWIAPYQDIYGNYHNESSIYTVARKSNWVASQGVVELDEIVLQNK